MIAIIRACLLLFVLRVAADLNDGPTLTTVVTETTTLYATLIPPVLPAVTVSTSRTQSVFTSTTTLIVDLNCTATAYSVIVAPPPVASVVASVPSFAASIPVATVAPVPSSKAARQVTPATLASSTAIPVTNSTSTENVVTSTVAGPTITATTTIVQRPAVTRTIYSVIYATQATPATRTVQQCSATQEIMYTIETATVTSVVSRIVWPSTITTVTFVECTPRPSISRIPPMGPSMALVPPPMALSTAGVQSKNKRQVIVSTTVHQTRIIYAATTVVESVPCTRVVTSCSVSTASTSAA